MGTDRTPIVYKIADNLKSLLEFQDTLGKKRPEKRTGYYASVSHCIHS